MAGSLPKISLAALPSPPAPGSVQMFDGYFPALPANSYQITVTHAVQNQSSVPSYPATQDFVVQAPEFFIDTTIVQNCYPPDGNTDVYSQQLPFLVLSDPSLPWERSLVPNQPAANPSNPTPWMALVTLAEGEIYLQQGTNNPVATVTVAQLLAADPQTLKPQLPSDWVSADVSAAQCQTIKITGAAFNAVMPSQGDLPYLAHCRGVNTLDEGEVLQSVLLCNRFPTPKLSVSPAAPVRYYAHLVSLEGLAAYLGPNATPIPTKPDSQQLQDVQLASLYHWSFVSLPQPGLSFEQLVQGLIQSEAGTGGALALPVPSGSGLPTAAAARLQQGYAPLTFVSGSGEESFAWYRGPLTPCVAQPVSSVGNPAVPVAQADNADELMIYLAEQGLFDLSLAAAWNLGRNLALGDANFAQKIHQYRLAASQTVNRLAQCLALPHLAGQRDLRALLRHNAARKGFTRSVGSGLGRQWHAALAAVCEAGPPASRVSTRPARPFARPAIHPRAVLALPEALEAVSESLAEIQGSMAAWLAALALLKPVPFSHLVPDPRMLPVESVRFFYVDPNWIDALTAGALSLAIHGSSDAELHAALLPSLTAKVAGQRLASYRRTRPDALPSAGAGNGGGTSGMLIRSQLVSGWPQLVVTATLGGAPLNIVRDETLAPNVRFCLFDGIPDTVTLAEPYQGLLFGVEDNGIVARCVTSHVYAGVPFPNVPHLQPSMRPPSGAGGGSEVNVLDVQATATALAQAVGVAAFASDATVQWNGQNLSTTFVSSRQLTAQVPASLVASAGAAQVAVRSGGATSLPLTFIIDEPLQIDAINPALIQAGSPAFTLTVSGTGFATGTVVQWNGTALPTTVISVLEATAAVPADLVAASGSAAITVLVNNNASNAVNLSVVGADPVLGSILPNVAMAGGAGLTLTIDGSGFAAGAAVQWNGQMLNTSFVNPQQLTAVVPSGLLATVGSASVAVLLNGTTSNVLSFTVADAAPTIGFLQPAVALAGGGAFSLTVNGVNFVQGAQIVWNGTALSTQFSDAMQLVGAVPTSLVQSAGTASVTVTSGGVTSKAASFAVVAPQPPAGLLQPTSVVAGGAAFTLTVTGGFGAGDFALQMVQAPEQQAFTAS